MPICVVTCSGVFITVLTQITALCHFSLNDFFFSMFYREGLLLVDSPSFWLIWEYFNFFISRILISLDSQFLVYLCPFFLYLEYAILLPSGLHGF